MIIPGLSMGRGLLAMSLFLCLPVVVLAFDVPANDGFVTDTAAILNPAQKQALEDELAAYRQSSSNEIAVVTVKTLGGEPIEDVALEIGRKWGIGTESKSNGILLLIASDDREMRMEVGYGLEGAVPDIVARGIIDMDLTPAFRQGDYYGGIHAAIDSLSRHIGGEYTADRYAIPEKGGGAITYLVFFGLIVLQWLLAIMARSKSWWLGGVFGAVGGLILSLVLGWWLSMPILIVVGLLLDFAVSKGYRKRGHSAWWAGGGWGGGGGFGGRGGGGFGGFGGGSFGGGGASGRW
ncbi:MAG: TPM domain-containing protein [Candidatus Peribacteraceae bacterium]|nr:TPM domain-containing protein [Candidatus Peribacteraceae bacterium]